MGKQPRTTVFDWHDNFTLESCYDQDPLYDQIGGEVVTIRGIKDSGSVVVRAGSGSSMKIDLSMLNGKLCRDGKGKLCFFYIPVVGDKFKLLSRWWFGLPPDPHRNARMIQVFQTDIPSASIGNRDNWVPVRLPSGTELVVQWLKLDRALNTLCLGLQIVHVPTELAIMDRLHGHLNVLTAGNDGGLRHPSFWVPVSELHGAKLKMIYGL